MQLNVFISYSKADRPMARFFYDFFLKLNCQVWIDYHHLDLQKCINEQIIYAIDQCDLLFLILSPASVESDWVKFEYSQALKMGKEIMILSLR